MMDMRNLGSTRRRRRNALARQIWREKNLKLEDWDPKIKWGKEELEHFGTLFLKAKGSLMDHPRPVLTQDSLRYRLKREIYNVNGVPDPSIVSGMYWRTHPLGLKHNPNRKPDDPFYK
jgi:hypothetical protein